MSNRTIGRLAGTAMVAMAAALSARPPVAASPLPPKVAQTPDTTWYHRGVRVAVYRGDPRHLEWEVVLPALPATVWEAWTDPAGIATWAAPAAAVDLRPGGVWEAHFFPDRPPGERGSDANKILAVVPGRELRLEAGAPAEFPTVRAEKTEFTVRLDPVGHGHTRVFVTQVGWKEGDEWDRAFDYLANANAEWLSWLLRRFVEGPIDWSEMAIPNNDP